MEEENVININNKIISVNRKLNKILYSRYSIPQEPFYFIMDELNGISCLCDDLKILFSTFIEAFKKVMRIRYFYINTNDVYRRFELIAYLESVNKVQDTLNKIIEYKDYNVLDFFLEIFKILEDEMENFRFNSPVFDLLN